MKRISVPIAAVFFITLITTLSTISCGDRQNNAPKRKAEQGVDTFTFFDVGRNSIFSDDLRRNLNQILGDDAIARRNIIDLEINYKGFLQDHFPQLDAINRQLNSPIGERVEHKTVKLMYRYARKKNVPFDYIEMIFSEYSRTPVLINIRFKRDQADTLASLEEKYGPPNVIAWEQPNAKSLYWRKNTDLLMVSLVPDQFGKPRYRIAIYFTQNLKDLVQAEKREQKKQRPVENGPGKSAF